MIKDKDNTVNSKVEQPNDNILNFFTKKYGTGSVVRLDQDQALKVPRFSTGLLSLDYLLGGGIPQGTMIEIFGKEGTGKTTLALQISAHLIEQKKEAKILYIDAESAANYDFFRKMTKSSQRAFFHQNNIAEKTFEVLEDAIENDFFDLIVLDSIAGLSTITEIKSDIGDVTIASLARIMSVCLKRISKKLVDNKVTLILINQLRNKVSTFSHLPTPEITCGGNSLKYQASIRLELVRTGLINKNDNVCGAKIRMKTLKNRFFFPFKEKVVDLSFGVEFSPLGDIIEWGLETEVLTKAGSWYGYLGKNLAQGKDALIKIFQEQPVLKQEIYDKIVSVFSKQQNA